MLPPQAVVQEQSFNSTPMCSGGAMPVVNRSGQFLWPVEEEKLLPESVRFWGSWSCVCVEMSQKNDREHTAIKAEINFLKM